MSKGFFITGTDTGCGKTQVSLALMQHFQQQGLKVSAMKPLASGCEETENGWQNEDAQSLLKVCDGNWQYEEINPYAFVPPIAPHIAAQRVGKEIDLEKIKAAYQKHAQNSDVVIVEGVGGWAVPIDLQTSLAELVNTLNLEVILVVGLRLGCINHASLSDRAIISDEVPYVGWISSEILPNYESQDETLQTLKSVLSRDYLGHLLNIKAKSQDAVPSSQYFNMISKLAT